MATVVLSVCSVQAVPLDYGLFRVGEHPSAFRLRQLKVDYDFIGTGRRQTEYAPPSRSACRLTLVQPEDWRCEVWVRDPNHKLLVSQPMVGDDITFAHAYAADFNRDGRWDYLVVVENSDACGLAAEIWYLTFLLSCPEGYAVQTLLSYDFEPRDFVDLNRDGQPELLHTMFIFGEAGKDGRSHNYWVYNLLTFSGTNIVTSNKLDPRFPRWVWYSFKPNHRDTDQLTAAQRRRLWIEAWDSKARMHGRPMFPDLKSLADEQGEPLVRAQGIRGKEPGDGRPRTPRIPR